MGTSFNLISGYVGREQRQGFGNYLPSLFARFPSAKLHCKWNSSFIAGPAAADCYVQGDAGVVSDQLRNELPTSDEPSEWDDVLANLDSDPAGMGHRPGGVEASPGGQSGNPLCYIALFEDRIQRHRTDPDVTAPLQERQMVRELP